MPYKEYKVKKVLFTIGDVAEIVGERLYGRRQILTSTLRFWEEEFTPWLNPERITSRKRRREEGPLKYKERRYRRTDIEKLIQIAELLCIEGYTLYGAKRQIILKQKAKGTGRVPRFNKFKMNHYE